MPDTHVDCSTDQHTALAEDLAQLVEKRLLEPLEIVLEAREPLGPLRRRVRADTDAWAAQLLGPDTALATQTASRLLAGLFGSDDEFRPEPSWWQTPFGRLVATRLGYPGRTQLSGSEAAAILGITRQGVHDLARRGKLNRTAEGRFLMESVQARLGGAG